MTIAGQAATGGCGCFTLLVMLVILAVFLVILGMVLWSLLISDSGVAQVLGIIGVLVIGAVVWLFVAAYLNPRDWRPRD